MKVPLGILKAAVSTTGKRMPSYPKAEWINDKTCDHYYEPSKYSHGYSNGWTGTDRPNVTRYVPPPTYITNRGKVFIPVEKEEKQEIKSNLSTTEFRLFTGASNPASEYIRCRGCLNSIKIKDKAYHSGVCKKIVLESIKLLRLDRSRCSSCNVVTGSEKWGVPLCANTACQSVWMFGLSSTYLEARQLWLARNPDWQKELDKVHAFNVRGVVGHA